MTILVTGGAGYIGSHTCVELLNRGDEVIIIDNLSNSKYEAVKRVEKITGKSVKFYENDLLDREAVERVFEENKIDAVIHFAGLKAVGESVSIPLKYYHNNLTSTLILCETMAKYGCKKIVFSSSATVYGMKNVSPLREDMEVGGTTNPYGTTKYMLELILRDLYVSDNEWSIVLLRYFNPIGAHPCGLIGEDPNGIPNNLLPYVAQVAVGKLPVLRVFGDDYDTPDGTGVRDFIHVCDLANGHLCAVDKAMECTGVNTYNLGTGNGYSVLDVVKAFSKACGKDVPYEIVARRPGDIGTCYSDASKAKRELGWEAKYGIDDMCAHSWNFTKNNPNGL